MAQKHCGGEGQGYRSQQCGVMYTKVNEKLWGLPETPESMGWAGRPRWEGSGHLGHLDLNADSMVFLASHGSGQLCYTEVILLV